MARSASDGIPRRQKMMWPVLLAIRGKGGSATLHEIEESVVRTMRFTESQQAIQMENGSPKIRYRIAWARTLLKEAGLVTNSQRAIWSLTASGQTATQDAVEVEHIESRDHPRSGQTVLEVSKGDGETVIEPPDLGDSHWKQQILAALSAMSPEAFERLSQRLLREAGFRDVKVTGKPGDGGIDGFGVYKLSLISFQIYFQCKRYRSDRTVTGEDVRSFRGAMRGTGDKGLFITTARFTTSAQQEASRNGVEPIELIDGDALCDLLKQYRLGVNVTERSNEDVAIDTGFFKAI